MNLCYIMMGLTWLSLSVGLIQAMFDFRIASAHHVSFMIFACLFYSLTITLVVFFFVGIGVSVREYIEKHQLTQEFYQRALGIKRKMYPPVLWNILVMIIVFSCAGAADTERLPNWIYWLIYVYGLFHFTKTIGRVHPCFKSGTQVILDMSGINKKVV